MTGSSYGVRKLSPEDGTAFNVQRKIIKMLKSKTVWTAILGALAGVAGYFTGELEVGAALNVVITSLLAIFLRHGIKKAEDA